MQIENKKQRQADREALDSVINNLSRIMSEDDGPRGRFTSRALEQASSPVQVRPLIKQEGHEYR